MGKDENGHVIEHVTHRALCADLAFGFGEGHTHIAKGTVRVVRQAFDQRHAAARAIAFIACRGIILAAAALGFLDGLVDHMAGHLVFFRAVNQAAQRQIRRGIQAARLRADIDFPAITAVHLGFHVRGFRHGLFTVLVGAAHTDLAPERLVAGYFRGR